MPTELTQEERLALADAALDDLLERYQVDICVDDDGNYFFDVKEPQRPELRLVRD